MRAVGVYDQVKRAFQDIIAPELSALRGDIHVLDQKIVGLDQKIDGADARLTVKIDALRTETVSIKGEQWQEVDFPEDVEKAESLTKAWAKGWGRGEGACDAYERPPDC